MIKGVNKQIIEVSQTSNRYFEKALLFVHPEYSDSEEQKLKIEADKILAGFESGGIGFTQPRTRKTNFKKIQKRRQRIFFILGAASGSICVLLLQLL